MMVESPVVIICQEPYYWGEFLPYYLVQLVTSYLPHISGCLPSILKVHLKDST